MSKREIFHEIRVNASPAELYAAVSNVEKLAHWWTTDTRGDSRLGKKLEFWFGDLCQEMEVTALDSEQNVHWHATHRGLPEWADTEIDFRIYQEDGKTRLHFKHSNWDRDAKMFPQCSFHWAIYLVSLKEFVETGKGRPYPYDMPVIT